MGFVPNYTTSDEIIANLLLIEGVRETVKHLPLNPSVLSGLKQTAKLESTHYSTAIEGNRLTQEQVKQVVGGKQLKQRVRDAFEVRGHFAAIEFVERWARSDSPMDAAFIKKLHGVIMGGGKKQTQETPFRDGQNVIQNSSDGSIVYMPPEAKDVPLLVQELLEWIHSAVATVPIPIVATISHYQLATIHPYYDGNGRLSRLVTNAVLHRHGYGLHGIYNLDAYYAKDLQGYYKAISVGPSHNYYEGRSDADITSWISYCIYGMAQSFESVRDQLHKHKERGDDSAWLRSLDAKQRAVLPLFDEWDEITTKQISQLLGLSARGARSVAQRWTESGFLIVSNPSKKLRTYRLGPKIIS
jgi:Fic family protein